MDEADAFRRFEDSVGLISDWRKRGPIHEVPFSALRGKTVKNLLVAGRCVSAKGDMWDIMRVIPPAPSPARRRAPQPACPPISLRWTFVRCSKSWWTMA